MVEKIAIALDNIKAKRPLIHQITNSVSINDCANITLAMGASPVMAQDPHEVEDMVTNARALVINIGTLQSGNFSGMLAAASRAKELAIPVVFDPVGAGATRYRTEAARRFVREIKPDIIRCNMSELKTLCDISVQVKGVDSVDDGNGGEEAAKFLAQITGGVIAVTGKTDIITDGKQVVLVKNGHELLTRLTGTGCMTSAITACFAAENKAFISAVGGVVMMGIAGEMAAEAIRDREGPGMFRIRLIDAVYWINRAIIDLYANLSVKET